MVINSELAGSQGWWFGKKSLAKGPPWDWRVSSLLHAIHKNEKMLPGFIMYMFNRSTTLKNVYLGTGLLCGQCFMLTFYRDVLRSHDRSWQWWSIILEGTAYVNMTRTWSKRIVWTYRPPVLCRNMSSWPVDPFQEFTINWRTRNLAVVHWKPRK